MLLNSPPKSAKFLRLLDSGASKGSVARIGSNPHMVEVRRARVMNWLGAKTLSEQDAPRTRGDGHCRRTEAVRSTCGPDRSRRGVNSSG